MDNQYRLESDSMGEIAVPKERYYGAQTARSLMYFKIGNDRMPYAIIMAIIQIKKAAAIVHLAHNKLDANIAKPIIETCDILLNNAEKYIDEFQLSVWQTGSGTQTNMNVNEVIANIANQKITGLLGTKDPIHPNNHVNYCQSSNDTFPTAMHIASILAIYQDMMPAMHHLSSVLDIKIKEFQHIIKIGRTHMQDAVPMTLGQEFSAYKARIDRHIEALHSESASLFLLAQGGTAVGTGINTYPEFAEAFASTIFDNMNIKQILGKYYHASHTMRTDPNKFAILSSNDSILRVSGHINAIAATMMQIANDIRLLSSGPRAGLGELIMPSNEPGSSIMPGKVNPTQCEAMTMVCAKVMGNHTTITIGCSNGHLQLNVYRPVIISSFLHSIEILSDAIISLTDNCISGIVPDIKKIKHFVDHSLMLATAMNGHIGYDNAAKVVKIAYEENKSLKEVVIALGLLNAAQYDEIVDPTKMIGDKS